MSDKWNEVLREGELMFKGQNADGTDPVREKLKSRLSDESIKIEFFLSQAVALSFLQISQSPY